MLGLAFLLVLGLLLYCRCCPGCSKKEKQEAHKPSPRPVRDSKKSRRRSKHTENGSSETTSKGESAETVSTTGKTTAGRRRSQPRNGTAESVSTGSSTPQIGTSRETTTGSGKQTSGTPVLRPKMGGPEIERMLMFDLQSSLLPIVLLL